MLYYAECIIKKYNILNITNLKLNAQTQASSLRSRFTAQFACTCPFKLYFLKCMDFSKIKVIYRFYFID